MALWNKGKVVEQRQWSATLHTLYVESDIEAYQAGQFVKIGLELGGKIIGRPYSLCNAPDHRPLEIYYVEVPGGELTPQLVKLKVGDEILVAPRANGFMVLGEVPVARHLWLIATGTGVGPFLSILDTDEPWLRFERIVLVYAVRTLSELSYQQRITDVQNKYGQQFVFVPFISREPVEFSIHGRIPQAIADGRLEAKAGFALNAADSQVMLCGNPQMIEDTMQKLQERGMRKHRRKEPGQITVEHYW
jgi:ferredoxin/flavodoxin---NADP+ reductase